jgi:hypothetical protein
MERTKLRLRLAHNRELRGRRKEGRRGEKKKEERK